MRVNGKEEEERERGAAKNKEKLSYHHFVNMGGTQHRSQDKATIHLALCDSASEQERVLDDASGCKRNNGSSSAILAHFTNIHLLIPLMNKAHHTHKHHTHHPSHITRHTPDTGVAPRSR